MRAIETSIRTVAPRAHLRRTPLVPMHPREAEETLTDTMHIALTTVTVLLILSSIAFGAAAGERWLRLYSLTTLLVVLVFGAWTALEGLKFAANQPTPWIGLTERICVGAWLLWVMVLAVVLLREQRTASPLHLREPAFGDT